MTIPIDPGTTSPGTPPAAGATVLSDTEKGLSHGRLVVKRFLAHTPAVVSVVVFVSIIAFAVSATGAFGLPGWWKQDYTSLYPIQNAGKPTLTLFPFSLGDHPFGQNTVGKDYFAMTMRGIVNSSCVMFVIGLTSAVIGVVVGAIAAYFRGWVDAVLMRITDVVIVIPVLVIGAVVGTAVGGLGPLPLAVFLGFVAWTGIARLVRAEFLSLREREFVEAARLAGASDLRIIFAHILPNAVGVIIVATTLLIAAAILLETALSFLGFGIRSPEVSLGLLISANESAFQTRPWLFWWPAFFIVLLSLLVNFVGDGLRDAFDHRRKRIVFRRVRELPGDAAVVRTQEVVSDVPVGAIITQTGTTTSVGLSSQEPQPDPRRES
jgi:peptide/nickel transport system permease protein